MMKEYETEFKYFKSGLDILNIFHKAVLEDKKCPCYFWFNSMMNIAQLQPYTCEMYITWKRGATETKWVPDMMNWPFLRIQFCLTCMAEGLFGAGILGHDDITLTYYRGIDLSKYDEDNEDWIKRGRPALGFNAHVKYGERLHEFNPGQENLYAFEEKLYNSINDGTLLDSIKKYWEVNDILGDIDSKWKI